VTMEFETLDQYRNEAENERSGWRGWIGRLMTFAGFIVLANAVVVALLFRHILSFRYQVLCAIIGAAVGVLGMLVRGNRLEHITTAAIASTAAILATVVVSLLEERFGIFIIAGLVLVFGWAIQRIERRVWKNL